MMGFFESVKQSVKDEHTPEQVQDKTDGEETDMGMDQLVKDAQSNTKQDSRKQREESSDRDDDIEVLHEDRPQDRNRQESDPATQQDAGSTHNVNDDSDSPRERRNPDETDAETVSHTEPQDKVAVTERLATKDTPNTPSKPAADNAVAEQRDAAADTVSNAAASARERVLSEAHTEPASPRTDDEGTERVSSQDSAEPAPSVENTAVPDDVHQAQLAVLERIEEQNDELLGVLRGIKRGLER